MKHLSVKHEMFAQSLIIYKGNQTKAYLEVYRRCSPKSAPSKASRLVRNGNVLGRVDEIIMGNSGLIKRILEGLAKNLNAEKVIQRKGEIITTPDHKGRMAAADAVLKFWAIIESSGKYNEIGHL